MWRPGTASWSSSTPSSVEQLRAQARECRVGLRATASRSMRASWRTTPSSRTITRSARTIASSTSWVTSRTAGRCTSHSLRSSVCMRIRVRASRAPNGSSASSSSRVADQRAGQRGALLLTAGELVRPRPLAAGEADLGERLRAALGGVAGPQAQHHVVEQALPRQQPRVLEDDRHPLGHLDAAGAGHAAVQPGEGAQERALAGAAATEQGHELAGGDVEVEAVEHATRLVEAAVQVPDPDRWGQLASVRRHDSAFLSMSRTTASAVTPRSA